VVTSGLYVGRLRHRRKGPVAHAFTYPVFMALLDVDRIPDLMRASRLTSVNRWNWASFDDRDHLADRAGSLRTRLEADAAASGLSLSGQILLLTNLRYLGYCFNPVSFFYCFDAAGSLAHVLAEVNNTFGGSYRYWLSPGGRSSRATAKKALYVSPFMENDLEYRFVLPPPGDRLVAHIDVRRLGATLFDATLSLERRVWSAREIRRALVRQPWMTASVTVAIHWQALRLWLKGLNVVARESPDGVFLR
jgi:DUF1365 family protein